MAWTIEEGLTLIRWMQPHLKPMSYHVVLGGGVLNTGRSEKDLDLYFLPFCDSPTESATGIRTWLETQWKQAGADISNPEYPPSGCFAFKLKFIRPHGKRIDVFIV